MPLANYTTRMSVGRTSQEIMSILAKHGASKIMAEYDGRGEIIGLAWIKESANYGPIPFRLPIKAKATQVVLERDGLKGQQISLEHAKRVAWRIVKDWIRAQMGLLETEMVSFEEIFLPYMLTGGQENKTMFEKLEKSNFQLLTEGQEGHQ